MQYHDDDSPFDPQEEPAGSWSDASHNDEDRTAPDYIKSFVPPSLPRGLDHVMVFVEKSLAHTSATTQLVGDRLARFADIRGVASVPVSIICEVTGCQGRRQNIPVGRSKNVPPERSLASVNVRASCSGEVSQRQAGSRLGG